MKENLIITIDGPSGVGKSSAARFLAERLRYFYLESGRLYRAIAWKVVQDGVPPEDVEALEELCRKIEISVRKSDGQFRFLVSGQDVTDALKVPGLDQVTSLISQTVPVRTRLLQLQREIGGTGGVIVEGRDIGSVILPDAHIKFYLDSTVKVRAERRFQELIRQGVQVDLPTVQQEIQSRDYRDIQRDLAPLTIPEEAVMIDATDLTLREVVRRMESEIFKRFSAL